MWCEPTPILLRFFAGHLLGTWSGRLLICSLRYTQPSSNSLVDYDLWNQWTHCQCSIVIAEKGIFWCSPPEGYANLFLTRVCGQIFLYRLCMAYYLHLVGFMVNVGKHTSPMDAIGSHISGQHFHQQQSSWWLNQPIWKICSSNWIISPRFGVKIKKTFELPPPSFSFAIKTIP